MTASPHHWHIPVRVDDVPESGLRLVVPAGDEVRAHLAALAGVLELSRLEAMIEVMRHGESLRASGRVRATVAQSCVVTLETLENEVDEAFEVIFAPDAAGGGTAGGAAKALNAIDDIAEDAPPEALVDGTADIGAIATEFLLLGIDPYPRKVDAVFTPPAEPEAGDGPFAALARFKSSDRER